MATTIAKTLGGRRLACSLLFVAILLLYVLVATGNARADGGSPTSEPAAASQIEATADTAGAETTAPSPSQQASTDQGASSSATVTQQQPRNIVISVRIDSPGNDGAISQTNTAAGLSSGTNDSTTTQNQTQPGGAGSGSGDAQAGSQQAPTGQTATSTATVTQDQAGNLVISVRINSPGDNGPISQTNTAIAVSVAGNSSTTDQNQGAPANSGSSGAPDDSTGTPESADPPAQTPVSTQRPVSPATTAAPPAPAAAPTATKLRLAVARTHHARKPAAAAKSSSSGSAKHDKGSAARSDKTQAGPTRSSAVAPTSAQSEPRTTVRSATGQTRPIAKPKAGRHQAATHGRTVAAKAAAGIRRATDFLGGLTPSKTLKADNGSQDVTGPVVLTLIAVLGAVAVFLGSAYPHLLGPLGRWRG